MHNCFDCSVKDECEASRMLFELRTIFPDELCDNIENVVRQQFDCEYYEN